jgi:hypothetical protein
MTLPALLNNKWETITTDAAERCGLKKRKRDDGRGEYEYYLGTYTLVLGNDPQYKNVRKFPNGHFVYTNL